MAMADRIMRKIDIIRMIHPPMEVALPFLEHVVAKDIAPIGLTTRRKRI